MFLLKKIFNFSLFLVLNVLNLFICIEYSFAFCCYKHGLLFDHPWRCVQACQEAKGTFLQQLHKSLAHIKPLVVLDFPGKMKFTQFK